MPQPQPRLRLAGTVKTLPELRFVSHRLTMADVLFSTKGRMPSVKFWVSQENLCFAQGIVQAARGLQLDALTSRSQ